MSNIKAVLRSLLALSLGALAPLALAQMLPGGMSSDRAAARNSPQWQTCKKQADDKRLAREERKAFMQKCMNSKGEEKEQDAGRSQALLDKMRAAQGGHLHSEAPPPAPAAQSPASPQP